MDTTTSYERSSSTGWELGVEENTRFQLVIRCARAHSKSARSVSLLPPHPRRSGANKTVAPHHIPPRSRIWRYPYRASRCSLPSVPTLTMAPAGPAPLRNGPAAIRSKALPAGRILAVTILALLASGALSYLNPIARVRNDFLALTRKSTTRHIVLPKSTDAALKLKQKIRNRVADDGEFVVDAFEAAARRYSLDRETGERGGLLGELLPQGSVAACPELDEACFRVPLGDVYGPIESDFGYHLVLVSRADELPQAGREEHPGHPRSRREDGSPGPPGGRVQDRVRGGVRRCGPAGGVLAGRLRGRRRHRRGRGQGRRRRRGER